jgi:hypothetical protein
MLTLQRPKPQLNVRLSSSLHKLICSTIIKTYSFAFACGRKKIISSFQKIPANAEFGIREQYKTKGTLHTTWPLSVRSVTPDQSVAPEDYLEPSSEYCHRKMKKTAVELNFLLASDLCNVSELFVLSLKMLLYLSAALQIICILRKI